MKRLTYFIFFIFCALSSYAQWKGNYATDEYTEEKIPQVIHELKKPLGFVRYIQNALEVNFLYTSYDNFDLWWNAQMEDNGWITYTSDVDLNFIGNSPQEFSVPVSISNNEKDMLYFSFVITDSDDILLSALKANRKLKIRFYDIVKEQTIVLDIPLTGFTAACKRVRLS